MEDAMVTGRMSAEKKAAGNAILERAGLNASQAVNLLYDRLLEDGNASILFKTDISPVQWSSAAKFVDALHVPYDSRFDNMTRGDIKRARAKAKGLI